MSSRAIAQSRFAVLAAALLMSSIAIGAAVGPGTAGAGPSIVNVTYA